MKRFDWYIIKKFLSTFLFTLSLILVIVIVFDISEKKIIKPNYENTIEIKGI